MKKAFKHWRGKKDKEESKRCQAKKDEDRPTTNANEKDNVDASTIPSSNGIQKTKKLYRSKSCRLPRSNSFIHGKSKPKRSKDSLLSDEEQFTEQKVEQPEKKEKSKPLYRSKSLSKLNTVTRRLSKSHSFVRMWRAIKDIGKSLRDMGDDLENSSRSTHRHISSQSSLWKV